MSERTEYAPGTPSWADNASADPAGAAAFYGRLFGWQTEDQMPAEAPGEYHMATLRGKNVAALGSNPQQGAPAVWNTYVTVASADDAAVRAADAGGGIAMEPFDVMQAGRMAALTDPAGAMFFVWEPRDQIGAELVNEPGTLTWNELSTDDIEGSKRFYGELFGWTTSPMNVDGGEYTLWHLKDGEAPIGGLHGVGPGELASRWGVSFAVDDTDAAVSRCEELGGSVAMPAFDSSIGRIAVLADPQGASFAVITLSPSEA